MKTNKITLTKIDFLRLTSLINREKEINKRDQGNLLKLLEEINNAIIVDPEDIDSDIVTMNSVVKFTDVNSNMNTQMKIVYPKDADINKKNVSILAPIGTALLGYKKGDIVEWSVPGGIKKFLINEITYQPEESGEYLT